MCNSKLREDTEDQRKFKIIQERKKYQLHRLIQRIVDFSPLWLYFLPGNSQWYCHESGWKWFKKLEAVTPLTICLRPPLTRDHRHGIARYYFKKVNFSCNIPTESSLYEIPLRPPNPQRSKITYETFTSPLLQFPLSTFRFTFRLWKFRQILDE